eukprot:358391-Chlamydomonas_euryale.AAC.5
MQRACRKHTTITRACIRRTGCRGRAVHTQRSRVRAFAGQAAEGVPSTHNDHARVHSPDRLQRACRPHTACNTCVRACPLVVEGMRLWIACVCTCNAGVHACMHAHK